MLSATIVIPQLNQCFLTERIIADLRRHDSVLWPILIADNGSRVNSVRNLHTIREPNILVLHRSRPGLTAAWNAAIQQSVTDILVFLNNDVRIAGNWVQRLIAPIQTGISSITAVELRIEKTLQSAIEIPSGWCFAVHRSLLIQLGGFDEALQLYFSDTDFFLRARNVARKVPWVVVPDLPLTHAGHQTTRNLTSRRRLWAEDRGRFLNRFMRGNRES